LKLGNSCVTGAANWGYWSGSRGSTGEGSFLLVVGAAILSTAVGCSLVLELVVPCLSRELQAWSTAVGCSSGTGWKILRRAKDGTRNRGASGLVDSFRFCRYSCLCLEIVPDSCRPILVT